MVFEILLWLITGINKFGYTFKIQANIIDIYMKKLIKELSND